MVEIETNKIGSVATLLASVAPFPLEVVFESYRRFQEDIYPKKINGCIGTYSDKEGKCYIFNVVRSVQESFKADKLSNDYLAVDGLHSLFQPTRELIFSKESQSYKENRIVSVQALSGTGALSLAASFAVNVLSLTTAYISTPTWRNHRSILTLAGLKVLEYPYWDYEKKTLCLERMIETLRQAAPHSLIILQTCGHNPTGIDPTPQQWLAIRDIVMERNLIPIFDTAYQGCCTGDLDEDVFCIRAFDAVRIPVFVAQSFAKNMGLYGQRVGMLHITTPCSDLVPVISGRLQALSRAIYSSSPRYGAYIVSTILQSEDLKKQWIAELQDSLIGKLFKIREELYEKFTREVPGSWDFLLSQRGLFFLTGLTEKQCAQMEKKHIYILPSGRFCIAGLYNDNIDYFVQCMKEVLT